MAACSSHKPDTTKEPVYFLFATPLSNHTLWLQAKDGMEDACNELDIYCDWKGPTSIDTTEMENVIKTGLLQKTDGIITQGVINPSLIEEGNALDIPFVLVDSDIQGSKPLAVITKDFTQQAELLLEDIEKSLGKEEKLYIGVQVSQLSFDLAQGQLNAVKEVFKKHKGGFEIIAVSESKSDKLHSREEWQKNLDSKMNVALNFAGESASGCVEAMESTTFDMSHVLVYGVDDMEDTMQFIKDGKIKGSIVTSFYKYGYDAVYLLYDAVVEGKTGKEHTIAASLLLVNQDNVKTYQKELSR